MEDIFDFSKTYAGAIINDEHVMPCNLAFPDGKIVFTLVSLERSTFREYSKTVDFYGYITTEKGIKNFKASNAFQIANSSTWSSYTKQKFLANGLIITHEKNNLQQKQFAQVNIVFDKLEFIGKFIDVNQSTSGRNSFSIKRYFKKLEFLSAKTESLILENPFTELHSPRAKTKFSVKIEPYFSLKPAHPTSTKDLESQVIRVSWFLQLLLELRQQVTDMILVDTPDFIPSIPTFKNEIKSEYKTAYDTFQKAYKQIETDPSRAVGLANSALESIVKEILKDDRFASKLTGGETLYKLASIILKEFNLTNIEHPKEIKTIGNSLLNISQAIETLRSEKTNFHGKTAGDYLLNDTIFASFVMNSVATVGLFLNSYYKIKFPKETSLEVDDNSDDLPF